MGARKYNTSALIAHPVLGITRAQVIAAAVGALIIGLPRFSRT